MRFGEIQWLSLKCAGMLREHPHGKLYCFKCEVTVESESESETTRDRDRERERECVFKLSRRRHLFRVAKWGPDEQAFVQSLGIGVCKADTGDPSPFSLCAYVAIF